MDQKDLKIVQFHIHDDWVWILLSNGRVFVRKEHNGPYYWTEETWLEDLIEYKGKELIN